VLFNAHAGLLWTRLTIEVRRGLARTAGLSRKDAHSQVRVVFAKVAEFQARGVVHYHALVRLDGPQGSASPPPAWASVEMLGVAIREAAGAVIVSSPGTATVAARRLAWGRHVDVTVLPDSSDGSDLAVARYVAKYATKAAEATGVNLPALYCRHCNGSGTPPAHDDGVKLCRACGGTGRRRGVDLGDLSEHARTLVETCWSLGGLPELRALRLRRWAHQLGYRGHFTTKSPGYSTTFAALRSERATYNSARYLATLGLDPDPGKVIAVGDWRYAGSTRHNGVSA